MRPGRFTGHIRELPPEDLIKLLYCSDRDAAANSSSEIETHASLHIFTPALIEILNDERHPNRRIAQWCVLDLFEDLGSFCYDDAEQIAAIDAMAGFIKRATDDYARAVFKAGSVLGGQVTHPAAASRLIDCLTAPNRIGRRSAIHGLFHVVEWNPQMKGEVVAVLRAHMENEPDPQLKDFTERMAEDIENSRYEHNPEPLFSDEA